MLSALVMISSQPVSGSFRPLPETLVRTLASLVPATVEGVVRDLTLVAPAEVEAIDTVADHAGCEIARAGTAKDALLLGLSMARENNLFLLRCGRAPETGFAEELADLIRDGVGAARMRERPGSLMTRLAPSLAPVCALLIPRARLKDIVSDDVAGISARMGRAPLLRARARPVD